MQDSPQRKAQFDTLFSSADTDFEAVGYPSCTREISLKTPNRNDPNDYYRFLKILPSASDREIRKAIRSKFRQYHPDGWEPNEELFAKTKWIANIFLNPLTKMQYDNTPEGYEFRDSENSNEEVLDTIDLPSSDELTTQYHYFAFDPEVWDVELSQRWYESLVAVAPIFRYKRTVKVVLSNDKQPFWIGASGMFIIPRWWEPNTANAFALFGVLYRNTI